MKVIIITILLLSAQSVSSQTDSNSKKSKPSWGGKMPTRDDSPGLSFDTNFDDEEEEDSNDFGFDREAILDDGDSSVSPEDELAAKQKLEKLELERQQVEATRKLVLQQEQKLEEEKQRKSIDSQKALAKKKKENEKIAAQKALEDAKAIEEQTKEMQDIKNDTPVTKIGVLDSKNASKIVPSPIVKESTEVAPKTSYVWKKIKNAAPIYPAKLARAKKEGWVEVELTINNNGDVINALVTRTHKNNRAFNKAALKAVKLWKYDPPFQYGVSENLTKIVRLVFTLQ